MQIVRFEGVQVISQVVSMPQNPVESSERMSLRIASRDKSLLVRAATLQHTRLTDFVVRSSVTAAREVIERHEHVQLTERDSFAVLDLLENPPAPNDDLIKAAFALPK